MTIFVESPWPILFIGIVIEAVLGFLLLQTGNRKLLFAMIGVAALVGVGLLVERRVVTDQEAVEQTLDAAVAAVVRNDLQGTLNCISPSAKESQNKTRWVFSLVEFREGHIRDLNIDVNRLTSPPSANVTFLAVGKGQARKGDWPYQGFAQRVKLQLRFEGGRWLVTGYDFEDSGKL